MEEYLAFLMSVSCGCIVALTSLVFSSPARKLADDKATVEMTAIAKAKAKVAEAEAKAKTKDALKEVLVEEGVVQKPDEEAAVPAEAEAAATTEETQGEQTEAVATIPAEEGTPAQA
jgi:hypothetical protein